MQLPRAQPKVSNDSTCDKSYLLSKKSPPSTALPYFDITTRRRAQNQARSDRRNAEGDARRERHRLRQAAARAARRFKVTPAGLYKLDSGWDRGEYTGWKFFIVVWDGATIFGSVSKTKTRHNIVFVFFFSNPG